MTSKLSMANSRLLLTLLYVLCVIATLSDATTNVSPNNSVLRPDPDSKCHVYNTYNYYNSHLNTASNKRVEALLYRVINKLHEIREEVKSLKGNKTIGEFMKSTLHRNI